MSARVTWAIARRVLWQIRRDPRTIALLLVVPVVLLVLLRYVFDGEPSVFRKIGVPLCGLFPFIVMFLDHVDRDAPRAHERHAGTADDAAAVTARPPRRLRRSRSAYWRPSRRSSSAPSGSSLLGLDAAHGAWLVALLAIGNAILGMALGLCGQRVRRGPSSRPCSSCLRSSSPNSSSAASSSSAARWARLLYWALLGAAAHVLLRRTRARHESGRARRMVRARRARHRRDDVAALALGAATLKRRTA